MNWRVIICTGALVAASSIGCIDIPIADSGDTSPWGLGSSTYPDYDRGYDYDDERAWEREHRRYGCSDVENRIRYDRAKLASIDPSKHHKAAQWYRDDLSDAERDREECRRQWDWQRKRDRDRRDDDGRADQRADCAKIRSRIASDRAKLKEINPSKHHKAAQWYQDDLRNAERELAACR